MKPHPLPSPPTPSARRVTRAILLALGLAGRSADLAAADRPTPASPADPVRFTSETASYYYLSPDRNRSPVSLFFPPAPPTLGRPVPLDNPFQRGEPAPAALAGFVHEIFYPVLATRLASGDLPGSVGEQLRDYRARKVTLQNQLRQRLATLREAEPSVRERELAQLAAVQAPALAALEATADQLRTELRHDDVLGQPLETGNWAVRPPPAAPDSAELPPALLRRAAFYQDGLSIDQRLLLQETALARAAPAGAVSRHMRYFFPATASFELAREPSPQLARKLADFDAVKRELLGELQARLTTAAPAAPAARIAAFRRLAAEQAPRFAALEALAEEIRRDLAGDPAAPGPPLAPELPADLSARIAVYRAHKQEAIRVLHEMLAADAATARAIRFQPSASGPDAAADPPPNGSNTDAPAGVSAFERRQRELVAALNQEKASIRESLAAYVRTVGSPRERKSVDDLLRDFEDARQQQELWVRFRDYQAAVLSPGLSPAQRRLLFDAAVEELAPPLPPGTPAP